MLAKLFKPISLAWFGVFIAFLVCFYVYIGKVAPYQLLAKELRWSFIGASPELKLAALEDGRFLSIRYLNDENNKVKKTLTFRQSDLSFYGRDNYLSHLDPAMVSVYQAQTQGEVVSRLRGLGVSHFRLPSYPLPVIYGTVLKDVISNPQYVRVVFDGGQYRLLELLSDTEGREGVVLPLENKWYEHSKGKMTSDAPYVFGGLQVFKGLDQLGQSIPDKMLVACAGLTNYFPLGCGDEFRLDTGSDGRLVVEGDFQGSSTLGVYLYGKGRKFIGISYLAHVVGEKTQYTLSGILPHVDKAVYFRPFLALGKRSEATVNAVSLVRYDSDQVMNGSKALAASLGWEVGGGAELLPDWGVDSEGRFFYSGGRSLATKIQFPVFESGEILEEIRLSGEGVGEFLVQLEVFCDLPDCYKRIELQPIFLDGEWDGVISVPEKCRQSILAMKMGLEESAVPPFSNKEIENYAFRLSLVGRYNKKLGGTKYLNGKIKIDRYQYIVKDKSGDVK